MELQGVEPAGVDGCVEQCVVGIYEHADAGHGGGHLSGKAGGAVRRRGCGARARRRRSRRGSHRLRGRRQRVGGRQAADFWSGRAAARYTAVSALEGAGSDITLPRVIASAAKPIQSRTRTHGLLRAALAMTGLARVAALRSAPRHDYSVAPIARAAASGSSAWVIGRPMTRIEAPASSAARGVTTRFWSPALPLAGADAGGRRRSPWARPFWPRAPLRPNRRCRRCGFVCEIGEAQHLIVRAAGDAGGGEIVGVELVSIVTATTFVLSGAAALASSSIARPRWRGRSGSRVRAAPAPGLPWRRLLGMSWSFRSRKIGRPSFAISWTPCWPWRRRIPGRA